MQETREQITRKRRRGGFFRRNILYILIIFIIISLIIVGLSLTIFFNIKSINVIGNDKYNEEDILNASGFFEGDNLWLIDKNYAIRKIYYHFPYVKDVVIQRKLPDTINIKIDMTSILLYAFDGKGYVAVSEEGRIIENEKLHFPKGQVPVFGLDIGELKLGEKLTDENKDKIDKFIEFKKAIENTNILSSVSLVDLSNTENIQFLYQGRIIVNIGSISNIDEKIDIFKGSINAYTNKTTIGTLDLSQKLTARLREYNIYKEENWPFEKSLIDEYKRSAK